MAIYMKIDGIDGNVTTKGYEKWIELSDLDWKISRGIKSKPGNVADREATKPAVSELTIKKIIDESSPHIFTETCVGKAKSFVKIHLCKSGDTSKPYMEYTLNNVLFSHYGVRAGYEDSQNESDGKTLDHAHAELTPVETISLNFDKVEMKFTPYDASHKPGSPVPAGYDLATATKV